MERIKRTITKKHRMLVEKQIRETPKLKEAVERNPALKDVLLRSEASKELLGWEDLSSPEESLNLYRAKAKCWRNDAKTLSDMIHSGRYDLADIQSYINKHPIDSIWMLFRLLSLEREKGVSDMEKDFVSRRQSEAAKNPRLRNRKEKDREIVQEFWDKWQIDKSLYKGVTAFDNAMMDKTDVGRNSILNWRKILKSGKRLV